MPSMTGYLKFKSANEKKFRKRYFALARGGLARAEGPGGIDPSQALPMRGARVRPAKKVCLASFLRLVNLKVGQ